MGRRTDLAFFQEKTYKWLTDGWKRYSTSLIKSTVSYHFTPVGMVAQKDECWWGWEKRNPCTLLVGMVLGIAPMENVLDVPQKFKKQDHHVIQKSQFPWVVISKSRKQDIKEIYAPLMSTAALFTATQIWKQPNVSINREVVQILFNTVKNILPFIQHG